MPSDLLILAAPRISAVGFRDILRRHGSPAALEAGACFEAFAERGVDPAVGLAIFAHESSYGRLGIAHGNRSWGNVRRAGVFVSYASWAAGAADLAALLVLYGHNTIRPGTRTNSVLAFPFVFAPAADHNAPAEYGRAVLALVLTWAATYPPRAGRLAAHELRTIYRLSAGRLTRSAHPAGLSFSANIGPRVRLSIAEAPDRRYTFVRILTGAWRGRYIHVSDPGLTFFG